MLYRIRHEDVEKVKVKVKETGITEVIFCKCGDTTLMTLTNRNGDLSKDIDMVESITGGDIEPVIDLEVVKKLYNSGYPTGIPTEEYNVPLRCHTTEVVCNVKNYNSCRELKAALRLEMKGGFPLKWYFMKINTIENGTPVKVDVDVDGNGVSVEYLHQWLFGMPNFKGHIKLRPLEDGSIDVYLPDVAFVKKAVLEVIEQI